MFEISRNPLLDLIWFLMGGREKKKPSAETLLVLCWALKYKNLSYHLSHISVYIHAFIFIRNVLFV